MERWQKVAQVYYPYPNRANEVLCAVEEWTMGNSYTAFPLQVQSEEPGRMGLR